MSNHEAAGGFSNLLEIMAQQDFFTLVLPFVVSYVVFYMAINQLDLFEKQQSSVIALAGSFFTSYFIASNPAYQTFFIDYFGLLTVGLIGVLGLLILLGLIGWETDALETPAWGLVILSIAGAAFTTAGGFGESRSIESDVLQNVNWGELLIDSGAIWLIVIIGVIWWLGREGNDHEDPAGTRALEALFGNIDTGGG